VLYEKLRDPAFLVHFWEAPRSARLADEHQHIEGLGAICTEPRTVGDVPDFMNEGLSLLFQKMARGKYTPSSSI
jgi:hypothetical protein